MIFEKDSYFPLMEVDKKSKPTMREIAERRGVSHTAVSFVLRGRAMGIKAETQQEILSTAISLNYHTRSDQRINSQKYHVLFLVPTYNDVYGKDSYAGRLFAHMSSLENQTGVQLILQASPNRDIIRSLYRGICEDRVDVVIPINLGVAELTRIVELSPVPVICLNLWAEDICSRIGFDDLWIGSEAARQFYNAGHRRAAVFTSSLYKEQRAEGFRREWKKLRGKLSRIKFPKAISMEAVYEKMRRILSRGHDFSAIFCLSDDNAISAMQAIRDSGLSVPEDISVIGCDNHDFTKFSNPPLSTFNMDEKVHAEQLMGEIMRFVKGGVGTKLISNSATFIKRESIFNINESKTAKS